MATIHIDFSFLSLFCHRGVISLSLMLIENDGCLCSRYSSFIRDFARIDSVQSSGAQNSHDLVGDLFKDMAIV